MPGVGRERLPAVKMHGYVEVTIAVALLQADGTFLNDDMADVTLAFGLPTKQPPRTLTDHETRETIRHNLSRVAASIEAMLIANGAQHLGQVDEPMNRHSREVGTAYSEPVTVHLQPVADVPS